MALIYQAGSPCDVIDIVCGALSATLLNRNLSGSASSCVSFDAKSFTTSEFECLAGGHLLKCLFNLE